MKTTYTLITTSNLAYFYKHGIEWYQSRIVYVPCSRQVIGLRLHLSKPLTPEQQDILPDNAIYDLSTRTILIYSKAQLRRVFPSRKYIDIDSPSKEL